MFPTPGKLRVGYYLDDGIFPPTPGVVRRHFLKLTRVAQQGLLNNRCELSKRLWTFSRRMDTRWVLFKTSARLDRINAFKVEAWQPPDLPEIFNVFVQLLLADKGFHFLKTMKYEVTNIRRDVSTIPSRRSTKRSR